MKQADLGLILTTKRMRNREFLAQMERVVPWAEVEALIAPHAPGGSPRAAAVRGAHDAAYPLQAAVIHALRRADGRGSARRAAAS